MRRGMVLGGMLITASIVLAGWVLASGRTTAEESISDVAGVLNWTNSEGQAVEGSAVVIPAAVTEIQAFKNYNDVTQIDIAGAPVIDDYAFNPNTSLAVVNLGSTTSIGDGAFTNTGITYISIPATTSYISPTAFNGSALAAIEVAADNPNYASSGGCLYKRDGASLELIYVPDNYSAETLEIPEGCTTVGSYVINGNFQYIKFPSTITSVGAQHSLSLKTVYYTPKEGSTDADDPVGREVAAAYAIPYGIEVVNLRTQQSGGGNTDPTPDNPTPDNPTPDNPTPDNPTPDNPTPDNPKPDNPTPSTTPSESIKYGCDGTNHTYDLTAWSYDSSYHWHVANCGHDGTAEYGAHKFSDWTSTKQKTDNGDVTVMVRICSVCGYSETKTTTTRYVVNKDGSISKVTHTKDSTPKTADGFDSRYLLCMAIFLAGIATIVLSKQRKVAIAIDKINNR